MRNPGVSLPKDVPEQFRKRLGSMLIVGGGLAFTAIAVFFAWRLVKTCQVMWRERTAKKKLAGEQRSGIEKVGAD